MAVRVPASLAGVACGFSRNACWNWGLGYSNEWTEECLEGKITGNGGRKGTEKLPQAVCYGAGSKTG